MNIVIYSQPGCSACEQAKALAISKGITITELILNVGQPQDPNKRYVPVQELKDKAPNARTMPQIFDGKIYIGGLEQFKKYLRYD